MEYRIMEEVDITLLIPLYIEYYNKKEDGEWTEQTVYKRIHQVWSREDSYCLVLEDAGRIIAFAMGYFEQYDDCFAYDLIEIVVASEYQNKGIGTAFMNELETKVRKKGAMLIQLEAVNDVFHEHFYGKLGYKNAANLVLKCKSLFYSKDQLKQQLQEMGLQPTDALMVHSSMRAIGPVEGGADTVLDALMEYFEEGQLMLPTHTWAQMSEEYNVFDPETEPACVGLLPNLFRKRPGVVRSLHPTHSIAAYGRNAKEYIKGEEDTHTPCAPDGCWGRLGDIHAKILLVGVTHNRNTFIHGVEEAFEVPERLTEKPVAFYVKLQDGSLKQVDMYRHYNKYRPDISENYDKLKDVFFEAGAAKRVRFGDAECILCDAQMIYEVVGRVLKEDIDFFVK